MRELERRKKDNGQRAGGAAPGQLQTGMKNDGPGLGCGKTSSSYDLTMRKFSEPWISCFTYILRYDAVSFRVLSFRTFGAGQSYRSRCEDA